MSDTTITDRILVQRADFSLADEYARLATRADSGACLLYTSDAADDCPLV